MRDEISHFKVRGRQVKDGQSFHCLNMCFSVEDYSAVANASISCVSFLENPLFHFERKKFLILFLFVCSVLFFGEVLVLLKNGTLCQHNNQFLKPKKQQKTMPLPSCQRDIQLWDIEEYSSALALSQSLIAFHLHLFIRQMLFRSIFKITKTTSLPDHFNAYIIRHYWNIVYCQFWASA